LIIGIAAMLLAGCSPVLNREYMQEGAREFQLLHLVETPEVFKDHLFILGGLIVETKLIEKGSQIEALYMPVNARGYLQDDQGYQGRFLALYPKSLGLLDPMLYKKGREITLAADFLELRKGKIDDMEYTYPVFVIRQIYLWEENRYYNSYWPGYYPYYFPSY
jgi:outer membrane lipoprotein